MRNSGMAVIWISAAAAVTALAFWAGERLDRSRRAHALTEVARQIEARFPPALPERPKVAVSAQSPRPTVTALPPPAAALPTSRVATDMSTAPEPSAPPSVARAGVRPMVEGPSEPSDKQIGAAIQRGADFLLHQFNPLTHLLRRTSSFNTGFDILAVYALMQSGKAVNDPRLSPHDPLMRSRIDRMKAFPIEDRGSPTYSRAVRVMALSLSDRPEDRNAMKEDAAWLVKNTDDGAYTYIAQNLIPPIQGVVEWNNSTSQYGLLGVWSAAEVGFEVPQKYWQMVQRHWTSCQLPNGQWAYDGSEHRMSGTLSMTCGGLSSLFVAHDYLDTPALDSMVGREPLTPPLRAGLNWLDEGDHCLGYQSGPHRGYTAYGVERVGLASGFKYFGSHDWYREIASRMLRAQSDDGSWGEKSVVETAFHLLFLSRARHPVLMNKLRFEGYWANRPRDVANLARFAGRQLERPLNWQVVPLDHDYTDWMDSPILYLASHRAPHFSRRDEENLRNFVRAGGMVFAQSDADSIEFTRFIEDLSHRLFPLYEMQDVPANHPLYSVLYKVKPEPPLRMVSNGSRILLLHSPTDLTKVWQARDAQHRPMPFELGTNLFVYAAGKRDLRNRLETTYIPPVAQPSVQTVPVARLRYAGNWDPEPGAWPRYQRWFQRQTGYALDVREVAMKDLTPQTAPLACLTVTARYSPTAEEVAAIKRYVTSGGVLLVDVTGGGRGFGEQLQSDLFRAAFPDTPSRVIGTNHPLLSSGGSGMEDLSRPRLRQYTVDQLGTHAGLPKEIAAGRGHVLFTSLDLISGLLGTNTWGILGYEPAYAQALLKNVIFWTLDGQRD
jgi:hypothetical protein